MAGLDESALDKKWVVSLLKKSFRDEEPTELDDVKITLASAMGENFLSTVYRVQATMLLGSGRRKRFSIIVKKQIEGGKVELALSDLSCFPTECKMYAVVLPMLGELMEEFNDKRDTFWPNCFGHRPYSCIAMEDLGFSGYSSLDRKKWQTVEQGKMVLRTLARLHAMSKILLSRGILNDDDRGHYLFLSDTPVFRKMFPGCMRVISAAIRNHWGPEWRPIAESIASNENLICEKMLAASKYDKKFEVLNHGDQWTSNIMWKFTECENVPYSIKFVDWAFANLNSFIVDIIHFVYSSIVPSLRRKHLDELLDAYQEALERNLKFYGFQGYIPTRQDVQDEHDRMGAFILVAATWILPVTSTGVPERSFDPSSLADKPMEQCLNEKIYMEEKYMREVGPDLLALYEKGVLL